MSVRQSLLAILEQGPCYGYQLRSEFDRRTGSMWPLNVGQVYNTLDRLERDGLVTKAGADDQGHVVYEITESGRDEARGWLSSALVHSPSTSRDELAVKLAVSLTLPGLDVGSVLQTQRDASKAALQQARQGRRAASDAQDAAAVAGMLVLDALVFHLEAEVRWLDHVHDTLEGAAPEVRQGLPLDTRAPRRGRPAKAEVSGIDGHSEHPR